MAKVMLVEDDNNLREIYEARLQAEGYTVVSAKDGEEALVLAKAEKPDLIISDIMMPKISGFEMLDILRNTDGLKEVKIIMLTALGQSDDQQRADRLGADRYLVKSQVTLEDIVKVARGLLEGENAAQPTPAPAVSAPATPPAAAPAATPASIPVATPPATPAPTPPAPTLTPTPVVTASIPVAAPPTEPSTPPAPAPTPTPTPPPSPTPTVQQDEQQATADASSTSQEEKTMDNEIESFVAGATTDAPPPASPPITEPTDTPAPAAEASNSDAHKKTIITPLDASPKKDLATLLAEEEAKEITSNAAPATPPTTAPIISTAPAASPAASAVISPTSPPSGLDPNNVAL